MTGTTRWYVGNLSHLASAAATASFFAGIAVVPWLLLATWSTTWTRGVEAAEERLLALDVLIPPQMGGRPAYDELVSAGAHLGVVGALVALLPASFWGEGLRRGCLALRDEDDTLTGWRARGALLPVLLVLPLLTAFVLGIGDRIAPLTPDGGGGGVGDMVLRVILGFHVVWLALGVVLTWVMRYVATGHPRWWVAFLGGFGTSAFVTGFLSGFQIFLAIPVDVGVPFGGLGFVGGVVAVGLWLYLLHAVLLVGWSVTQAIERRARAGDTPLSVTPPAAAAGGAS
ncbi:YhjD/YihY/BrkB family envelope integrity protein [Nocardioides litoris]|uniref:YhjD/YihY/BrkB family envelope integrity protein n=1 Tax=Nocardioides litoris TaxID=1926648 RepID=UPI0011210522|nr:YhjD/YihY/BrkB family envelope integrity protein [Nocardioides litoris]